MKRNLSIRGCSLLGIEACPDLESQVHTLYKPLPHDTPFCSYRNADISIMAGNGRGQWIWWMCIILCHMMRSQGKSHDLIEWIWLAARWLQNREDRNVGWENIIRTAADTLRSLLWFKRPPIKWVGGELPRQLIIRPLIPMQDSLTHWQYTAEDCNQFNYNYTN